MAKDKIILPVEVTGVDEAKKSIDELTESIEDTSSVLSDLGVDTGIFVCNTCVYSLTGQTV